MALVRLAKDHPAFAILGAIVALIGATVGVLALIEPRYELVTSEAICGYTEEIKAVRAHQWNECENPSKVLSYRFAETISQSSGRVGGGYDQNWHCTNVKQAKERAVGQAIVWSNQKSHEESSRSWDGRVTYKYHCSIDGRWGPVYARERWDGCGEAALIAETVRHPKTCFDQTKRIGWKWKWQ